MAAASAIIIGGGIGGLAAAVALRRAGVAVDLFERAAELREVGAGLSLWMNAIRALDQIGLADVVMRDPPPDVRADLWSWRGTVLIDTSELRRRFGTLGVVVHRADLLKGLVDALGPAHVHLGSQCVDFQRDDAGVTARFADGRRAHADMLIGADGLQSTVRARLHGQRRPAYAGYTAWRAVVRFDHRQLRPGESWGRGARFGQMPMSDGRVYWYATRNAAEGERSADGEKAELLRTFEGWHAPVEALIDATGESAVLRNDVYDRPVLKRWGEGCVTLLGDAAHPMTPDLGQGACQALEDAVVLAECVRESGDVRSALRSYEMKRIGRASAVARQSRRIGRVGQWQNPLAVRLRDTLVKRVGFRLQANQLGRIVGDGRD